MEVIERSNELVYSWNKEVNCNHCNSKLKVFFSDLKRDYKVKIIGQNKIGRDITEREDHAVFQCCVCNKQNKIDFSLDIYYLPFVDKI